jgi:two-component system, OmpR family, phosphate regulon sensor histidine kinase PhoR
MKTQLDLATLESCVAAMPDAALVISNLGIIVAANPAAQVMFSNSAVTQHIAAILRAPSVLKSLHEVFVDHRPCLTQAVLRQAVTKTLDVHIAEIGNDMNGMALALMICKDVTYAQQIEKMRSDFVANASHELRTPLTTLSGFIETMQGAGKADLKAHPEFLMVMKTQADRMARLIDDLLSLSRIEVNEHVVPDNTVDLASVARMTASLLAPVARELSCTIELELPEKLLVRGDESQLTQVVHNLLENAIRYSGAGKTVTLRGGEVDSANVFSVIDNGSGIEAHHIPRLTERFYRVNTQESRTRGGTGLGLAICKHIINRHRGKLVIESEVGKGSRFSIHLPVLY